MTEAIVTAAVLAAMAALAVHDARRAMVDPRLVLALLAAAAAWRFGGGGPEADGTWPRLVSGVLGAALGVAAVMIPIALAAWCGRRWPLYPGDAMLLGAVGFLLGPLGLAWTMVLGSGFALIYRFCLQRRRGRPFLKGLVPLGPGMCAGAAVVFLCLDCGVALAEVRSPPPPLAATELAPERAALPAALADRGIVLEGAESLPFPALVRRLAAASGVAMRIEERPSRIAGGGAALDEPPRLRLAWEGTLAGLLDRVAALSGYGWSWEALVPRTLVPRTLSPEARVPLTLVPETLAPEQGTVVFHRYWDIEQRVPAPEDAAAIDDVEGSGAAAESGGPWMVDPAVQGSLRGVLESWAGRAGWTLVWKAEWDWRVGARAAFAGGFLEASDLLLSGPGTRRALDVRAYAANRHLVVDDADGAGW